MISMVDSLVQFENCQFDLYGPSQFSLSVWLFVQFPILIWVVVYQYSYVWLFINMIIFQLCLSVYHYCYCLVVYQYNHSNFIYQFITAAICFRMISFPYCSISICLISLVVDPHGWVSCGHCLICGNCLIFVTTSFEHCLRA